MSIPGYVDYKRREFCKDVKCPVQLDLETKKEGSKEYEKIRDTCKNACKYTTYQFHHWLINKGYLIVKPEK
jgi:bacterioferritin (cytochrome b1)